MRRTEKENIGTLDFNKLHVKQLISLDFLTALNRNRRKPLLPKRGTRSGVRLHIVQVHDLVLDVEGEVPPQEAAQILVDEVIGGIFLGVGRQVFSSRVRLGFFSVGARVVSASQRALTASSSRIAATA